MSYRTEGHYAQWHNVHFKVRQYPSGQPYIEVQVMDVPTTPVLQHGYVCIDLNKGASLEEADSLVSEFNKYCVGVGYVNPVMDITAYGQTSMPIA